jgi:nitronate monooxygenase
MMWLADATFVAAVARAGAGGFISALTCSEAPRLKDEIQKCRDLAGGKKFGVNLYISMREDANERLRPLVEVVCEEGIPFVETSGGHPGKILPALQEAGTRVLHKSPALRFAQSAARAGADALILVGAECGGHPGYTMIGSFVQAARGPQVMDLPVVLGGGIGHGSQLAAALAMGCAGVLMGTRMMVAEEIWAHSDFKQRVIEGDGTDSLITEAIFRNHHRVLANETAEAVLELERQGITDFAAYQEHLSGQLAHAAYESGDTSRGLLDYGQAACFAEDIEPVEAIIDRMIEEAAAAVRRLQDLQEADS